TDGGNGLDDFMRVYFPRATLILDFYHAAGHLADLAQAWSGDAATAPALLDRWRHQMKHEGGAAVLRTLEGLALKQAYWDGALEHHPCNFRLSGKGFPRGLSISSERHSALHRLGFCLVS
ncbi:MAG TPA: hypothetical protein VKP69_09720, partial [Isosphaeraceae bacterium]|nr:hypothetical protein [Isosphaeraceae bacterium]